MQVILLGKVENLGGLGEVVDVKAGYGRNFLIPNGKAVPATDTNRADFDARRAELEKVSAAAVAEAQTRAEALAQLETVTVSHRTGDEGRLFGSVGTREVANAVTEAGVALTKQEIRMPDGAFRRTGEYEVAVHLHAEVNAVVKFAIVPESD